MLAKLGRYFLGQPLGYSSKVSLERYIYSSYSSSGSDYYFYSTTATTEAVVLVFFMLVLGGAERAWAAGLAI